MSGHAPPHAPTHATGMPVAANRLHMRAHEDGSESQSRFLAGKNENSARASEQCAARSIRLVE